jgi:hypothetical protein
MEVRLENNLKKWFPKFKEHLDQDDYALAVLPQLNLLLVVNESMPEKNRMKPRELRRVMEPGFLKHNPKLSKGFKEDWETFFENLNSRWYVALTKEAMQDRNPGKWHKVIDRAYQMKDGQKQIGPAVNVIVQDRQSEKIVNDILNGE